MGFEFWCMLPKIAPQIPQLLGMIIHISSSSIHDQMRCHDTWSAASQGTLHTLLEVVPEILQPFERVLLYRRASCGGSVDVSSPRVCEHSHTGSMWEENCVSSIVGTKKRVGGFSDLWNHITAASSLL
jgi:hypothetical protein